MVRFLREARSVGEYCAAIFLDIKGAFDYAWWPGIRAAIARRGCTGDLYALLSSYLQERTVEVEVAGKRVTRRAERGCPQGSRSGPGMWRILYGGLLEEEMPTGCRVIAFADDTTLLVRAKQYKEIKSRANAALGKIEEWAGRTKLQFNPSKSVALFYGRSLSQARPPFRMGNQYIHCRERHTYLGVVLDERLDWSPQIEAVVAKSRGVTRRVAAISRPTWGLGRTAAKVIYEHALYPALTYGAEVWGGIRTVKQRNRLRTAQRPAAIAAAGVYRSVSTEAALVIAGLPPLDIMVQERATF